MPRGFGGDLIARLGRPLAAPSANSSGKISATTAQAVAADLGARIRLVVDGGATPVGLESTIVKVEGGTVAAAAAGRHCRRGDRGGHRHEAAARRGRRHRGAGHACLALCAGCRDAAQCRRRSARAKPCWPSAAGAPKAGEHAAALRNLSESGDLREAASNLFAYMQDLDRSGARTIAVEPIPVRRAGRGDQRSAVARRRPS